MEEAQEATNKRMEKMEEVVTTASRQVEATNAEFKTQIAQQTANQESILAALERFEARLPSSTVKRPASDAGLGSGGRDDAGTAM